jgi:hypothetical protein
MRRRLPVRILGLTAALVVGAWFALGIRQGHDADVAGAIIAGHAPVTAAQARHARALLHDAGQLNPDLAIDLLRSQLALRRGDAARARAIALSVARREPQNLQAWLAYATASAHDVPAFSLAVTRLNALAPPVGS